MGVDLVGVLEIEEGVKGSGTDPVNVLSGTGLGSKEEDEKEGTIEDGDKGVRIFGSLFELGDLEVKSREGKRKRKLNVDINAPCFEIGDESNQGSRGFLSLRSGKKVAKRRMERVIDEVTAGRNNNEIEGMVRNGNVNENSCASTELRNRFTAEEKGKMIENDVESNKNGLVELNLLQKLEHLSNIPVENRGSSPADENRERVGNDEKGKEKLVEDGLLSNGNNKVGSGSDSDDNSLVECAVSGLIDMRDSVLRENARRIIKENNWRHGESSGNQYMERFRNIARQNACRFAHFPSKDQEYHLSTNAEGEREIEDWSGPFSAAMKIIKDRAASVLWVPRKSGDCNKSKPLIPSLKELCLRILAKNADAIVSLDSVPDALRHRLSRLLCDSRSMNSHFLELLLCGSPTEVHVWDCSWLTEEQFTKSFKWFKTRDLMVLQLDQCGRCMSDYILPSTLAHSPNSLPALTTLSLRGACRLSDVGLDRIVSSAPALQSLNLSQCSLLTSSSIYTLANLLGSNLRELYLNDCQSLDAMLILPALKKLEQLEVLSLVGIQDVSDEFIYELMIFRGHNINELFLTDCVKLTDSSLRVISETCSGLSSLDLVNLNKLTDFALGYLANGCRAIQTLKFCGNAFSDEAVAAFLETSGESLTELSLNNVKKVSHNTAISLAKRSRKLKSLDLSFCRNLTDEDLGFIVDSCLSLRMLKLFGCTQITNFFLQGHSNPGVQIIGLKMSPVLKFVKEPDSPDALLQSTSASYWF